MSVASRSLALWKRGWHEIPEIMGSGLMAVFGLGLVSYSLVEYYKKDGNNRRYRAQYTVIRHDDPRAAKVRKD